eukprot:5264648-Prymnesium_polylepis.1
MPLPVLREPSSVMVASGHELSSLGPWMTAVGVSHSSIAVVLRKSHGKNVLTLSFELATVLHFESAPVQLPVQPAGVKMPGRKPTSMPRVAAVSTVR